MVVPKRNTDFFILLSSEAWRLCRWLFVKMRRFKMEEIVCGLVGDHPGVLFDIQPCMLRFVSCNTDICNTDIVYYSIITFSYGII